MPPYSWAVSTGLPPGLAISGATIIGTPTASGTFAFILTVVDSQTNTASIQVSITINGANSTGPLINTTSLPAGIVNQPYSAQVVCTNCAGDTWAVTSGTLPNGLQLNATSGAITGTPIQTGVSSFQISLYWAQYV